MKRINVLLCLAPLLLPAVPAAAPAETPLPALTLGRCMELARERSYDLKIQSERRSQAEQRLKQSQGGLLPTLSYRYDRSFQDTGGGAAGDTANARLALSQPLFYGFSRKEAVNFSKSDVRREAFQYENVDRALVFEVTRAFYALAQAESDIANIRETYGIMQERRRDLAERVRLGKSRESEVLMLESQMALLQARERRAEGAREIAGEHLSQLTGAGFRALRITDDAAPVDRAEPLERYLAGVQERPDIRTARQDAVSQSYQVRVAKGALLPTLSLNGAWYQQRTGSLAGADWDTALLLNVPLFQGGIASARVREQESRLRENEEQVSAAVLRATTEIEQLHTALVTSIDEVRALDDAYAKALKSYQLQLRDYRYGLVDNLEVIQSMLTMLDVKSSLDRARLQAKSDKALLDIAAMQ